MTLAACAAPTAETVVWQRSSTSPEEARADLNACKRAAQRQVDQEQKMQGMAGVPQNAPAAMIDADAQAKRVDQLTRRCMTLNGYQPAAGPG